MLGLDYGDKTIGVALSDPGGRLATGLTVLRREREEGLRRNVRELRRIIREQGVGLVVLGYPLHLDGAEGGRCERTKSFQEKLRRNFKSLPVALWDERFTTREAEAALREAGVRPEDRKRHVDMVAAVLILQNYLDCSHTNNTNHLSQRQRCEDE